LVNALAGFQRSVVTAMPGTTRDVVTTVLAIDGWPVELIDTAGQHGTPDTLEQEGIARARAAAAAADLCLWVVAADTVPVWPDSGSSNVILVVNKIDLAPTWDTEAVKDAIPVSAQIGAELDTLCERVSLKLVSDPPAAGTGVPFAPVLSSGVEAVTDALLEGKTEIARTGLHALTRPSE
jgi:tRNA modification GTPase